MEEVKASKFCDMCGTQVGQDVSVCPSCGKKLSIEQKVKYCTNCGNVLDANSSTCQRCGFKREQTNALAIIGFVLSLPPGINIMGLILSYFGLVESKRLNNSGRTLSILGIIISLLWIVYIIIGIIVLASTDWSSFG